MDEWRLLVGRFVSTLIVHARPYKRFDRDFAVAPAVTTSTEPTSRTTPDPALPYNEIRDRRHEDGSSKAMAPQRGVLELSCH